MREILKDRWFWIIGIAALCLRLWHLYHAQLSPTFWAPAVDPLWYHETAQRVASGDFGPWPLFRAPLYPWLLGAVYALVDNDLLWARLLNIILQMATLVLIYRVALNYFGSIAARVAGILFAANGMVIFYSAEILSTSLEMLVAILAAWSTLALRKSPSKQQALICGIVWGFASIARPNFLLVAIPAVIFALWPISRHRVERLKLVALLGIALPIAPIALANWVYGQETVLIATQGGVNFWIGNNPQADGISSILPGSNRFWTMDEAQKLAEREALHDLSPGEVSDFYYEKGQDFLINEPIRALKLILRKTALFFNRFEVSNNKHIAYFAGQTPGLTLLILLNFALLLPLAVLALWGRQKSEARLLWGVILFYAASVVLFFIASRFRMPAVPWLCLIAGAGVSAWFTLAKSQKIQSSLFAFVILIITLFNPYNAQEANVGAAHYLEGNAYLALNNLDSARSSFATAQSDPGSRELAMLNLAVALQRLNNLQTAEQILRNLVKEFPNSAQGWNNSGVIYELEGDTTKALAAFEQAIEINPEFDDALQNLARLRLEEGKRLLQEEKPELAQFSLIKSALAIPSASAYYHLAVAYGQTGKTGAAHTNLDKALRMDPNYEPALILLRQLEADQAAHPIPAPDLK